MPKISKQIGGAEEVGDGLHSELASRFSSATQPPQQAFDESKIDAALEEASVAVADVIEDPRPQSVADELQESYDNAAAYEQQERARMLLDYARFLKRLPELSQQEKSNLLSICQELEIAPARLEADIATHQRVVQLIDLASTRDKQEAELIAACRKLRELEETYKREHRLADSAVYAARRKFNLADRALADIELIKETYPYLFGS